MCALDVHHPHVDFSKGTDSESAKGALLPAIGMGSRIYLLLHRVCLDAVTQIAIESQREWQKTRQKTRQDCKHAFIQAFNYIRVACEQF